MGAGLVVLGAGNIGCALPPDLGRRRIEARDAASLICVKKVLTASPVAAGNIAQPAGSSALRFALRLVGAVR